MRNSEDRRNIHNYNQYIFTNSRIQEENNNDHYPVLIGSLFDCLGLITIRSNTRPDTVRSCARHSS